MTEHSNCILCGREDWGEAYCSACEERGEIAAEIEATECCPHCGESEIEVEVVSLEKRTWEGFCHACGEAISGTF